MKANVGNNLLTSTGQADYFFSMGWSEGHADALVGDFGWHWNISLLALEHQPADIGTSAC